MIALLIATVVLAALVAFSAATARRVERLAPRRGKFISVDGQQIHYFERGRGLRALVMIHGLGGNLLNFEYALAGELEKDFRVVLLDRPGSGYSTRRFGADASPSAQAATIAAAIRCLGLERPLVVGHSLGGAIALALALDHPDCASALALIAPLTHPVPVLAALPAGLVNLARPLIRIAAWTLSTPVTIISDPLTKRHVFAPETPPPDFDRRAGWILHRRPKAFSAQASDMLAIEPALGRLAKRYSSLTLPIGVLFARQDRLLDYRAQGEAFAAHLPQVALELMEGGHMLPFTAPGRCADLVRRVAASASRSGTKAVS